LRLQFVFCPRHVSHALTMDSRMDSLSCALAAVRLVVDNAVAAAGAAAGGGKDPDPGDREVGPELPRWSAFLADAAEGGCDPLEETDAPQEVDEPQEEEMDERWPQAQASQAAWLYPDTAAAAAMRAAYREGGAAAVQALSAPRRPRYPPAPCALWEDDRVPAAVAGWQIAPQDAGQVLHLSEDLLRAVNDLHARYEAQVRAGRGGGRSSRRHTMRRYARSTLDATLNFTRFLSLSLQKCAAAGPCPVGRRDRARVGQGAGHRQAVPHMRGPNDPGHHAQRRPLRPLRRSALVARPRPPAAPLPRLRAARHGPGARLPANERPRGLGRGARL